VSVTVDASLDHERARHLTRIAQTFYTFWNTGEVRWIHEPVDPSFTDNVLPGGVAQLRLLFGADHLIRHRFRCSGTLRLWQFSPCTSPGIAAARWVWGFCW
jgi:hypothetical protein